MVCSITEVTCLSTFSPPSMSTQNRGAMASFGTSPPFILGSAAASSISSHHRPAPVYELSFERQHCFPTVRCILLSKLNRPPRASVPCSLYAISLSSYQLRDAVSPPIQLLIRALSYVFKIGRA